MPKKNDSKKESEESIAEELELVPSEEGDINVEGSEPYQPYPISDFSLDEGKLNEDLYSIASPAHFALSGLEVYSDLIIGTFKPTLQKSFFTSSIVNNYIGGGDDFNGFLNRMRREEPSTVLKSIKNFFRDNDKNFEGAVSETILNNDDYVSVIKSFGNMTMGHTGYKIGEGLDLENMDEKTLEAMAARYSLLRFMLSLNKQELDLRDYEVKI